MDKLPIDLEHKIYNYLYIHDTKYINSYNYNKYLLKQKKSKYIIKKNIIIYLYNYKQQKYNELIYNDKQFWKKYYPLKYRIESINLCLKKLRLDNAIKINISIILNSNNSIVQKYNNFINLLSIEQININGW